MADQEFTTQEPESEEWRPVVGYESLYHVSHRGDIRRNGAINTLKPHVGTTGYAYVTLCQHGVRRTITIHKLVATAFLGVRPQGKQINHKDGVKTHNHVNNLEYITPRENMQHAYAHGLAVATGAGVKGDRHYSRTNPELLARGERNARSVLKNTQVIAIRMIYSTTKISFAKLAKDFGVTGNVVRDIVRCKAWTHLP